MENGRTKDGMYACGYACVSVDIAFMTELPRALKEGESACIVREERITGDNGRWKKVAETIVGVE